MNRHRIFILGFTYILFFTLTLGVAGEIHASVGSSNYVIFRANIAPMYIANESMPIQVLAIPFEGGHPVGGTSEVYVKIQGINIKYSFSNSYKVMSGRSQMIYLPAVSQGHYNIVVYAEYGGQRSKAVNEDFGVTFAPIPYSLTISSDGSIIHFKSLRLNSTGQPDPKYPFTLNFYVDAHGSGEALVATYTNVTNLTLTIPANWKVGILYVEVVDYYGWHNGMTIDLADMQFSGVPLSYDYKWNERQPIESFLWQNRVAGLIIFGIFLAVFAKFVVNEERKRRWRR